MSCDIKWGVSWSMEYLCTVHLRKINYLISLLFSFSFAFFSDGKEAIFFFFSGLFYVFFCNVSLEIHFKQKIRIKRYSKDT